MVMPTSDKACRPPKRLETPLTWSTALLMVLVSLWRLLGRNGGGGGPCRGGRGLAVLGRRPQAARTREHHADHGQRDQQLAQDRGIEAATGDLLQRAGH